MHETDWQDQLKRTRQRLMRARHILGVAETAGAEEIRRAYRRACRATHPDLKNRADERGEDFRLVRRAYDYLTGGAGGEDLDAPSEGLSACAQNGYRVDNDWGYWCWWRESFFGT